MATSYWGVEHGETVSKADQPKPYTPHRGFRAQGLAYTDKSARRRTTMSSLKNAYSKDSAKTMGSWGAKGAGGGAALGAAASLASRGRLNARNTALGGGLVGGEVGLLAGAGKASFNAQRKTVGQAMSRGDITRQPKSNIKWNGMKRS